MNRVFVKYSFILVSLCSAWLLLASQASGGLSYDGRLGVDYEFHDYDTKSPRLTRLSILQRAISNHYLEFMLRGPIVNNSFATFSTRSKIYGTYFRTKNSDSLVSSYIDPNLQGFFGQLALFPDRRYPLQMFYSQDQEHVLKFEAKNQSSEGNQRPELAVVRRYDSKLTAKGANLQVKATDRISIETDISSRKSRAIRNYEFDEDQDLYLLLQPTRLINLPVSNPLGSDVDTSWAINIAVINTDTISGVTVYLEMDPIFFVAPGDGIKSLHVTHLSDSTTGSGIISFILDYQVGQYDDFDSDNRNNWEEFIEDFTETLHAATVIPDTLYNTNVSLTTIPGDMQWIVSKIDPGSPLDEDQEGNEFLATVTYDTKAGFRNTAQLTSSNRTDLFQGLKGEDFSLSNDLMYDLSEQTSVTMRTTNLTGSTVLADGRGQDNSSFSNLTDATYSTYGGKTAAFSHALNSMSSDDGTSQSSNLMNSFRGRYATPTGYRDHNAELGLTLTLTNTEQTTLFDSVINDSGPVRDTTFDRTNETSSSTLSGQLSNNLSFNKYGMTLRPDHILKYQIQGQSGSSSIRKLESVSNLSSENFGHKLLGSTNISLQHSYLRTMDVKGFNSTSKITTSFAMSKSLNENFTIRLGAGYVKSIYAGESQPTGSDIKVKLEKPSESQTSYQLGSKLNLLDRAFITSEYRVTAQATSTTSNLAINIKMLVPIINASLISDLRNEIREIQRLPTQTKFYWENGLSFSVRRIILYFEYNYAREERFGETFTYSLWSGKVTRSF